jgi:hypothetical protein
MIVSVGVISHVSQAVFPYWEGRPHCCGNCTEPKDAHKVFRAGSVWEAARRAIPTFICRFDFSTASLQYSQPRCV